MKTKTIEVYTFSELSESAKKRARYWWRSNDCWDSYDWWNSAMAFEKIAPISIESADYGWRQVEVKWTGDESVADLSGLRAWKWLHNNGWFDMAEKESPGACSLTGFCADASFFDPLMEYRKTPSRVPDLKQVFYEMAQSWVFEASSDYEYSYSNEAVDESIEANEYEFDAEGNCI
jgi:hypothetical protein